MVKKSVLLAVFLLFMSAFINAQTSAFTYQGLLSDGGYPAAGTYQMTFELFDSLSGGSQVGSPIVNDTVTVLNGRFTVLLDFGSTAFASGASRWLQISVKKTAEPNATVLTPRQALTSSPYSLKTLSATTADSLSPSCVGCVADANISDLAGSKVTGSVANATTAGHADTSTNSTAVGGLLPSSFLRTIGGTITGNLTVAGGRYFGNGSGLTNLPAVSMPWDLVVDNNIQLISNRGYISGGTTETVMTLPAAPLIGDIIRVTGATAAGWRINTNAGQSIASESFVDAPGVFSPTGPTGSWNGVAMSADGKQIVAVQSGSRISLSRNSGLTWIERATPRLWTSVASSADGTRLVAGSFEAIYTSIDSGETWSEADFGRLWTKVTSSADGTKLYGIAFEAGNLRLYSSYNSGATWTVRENTRSWRDLATSADGTMVIAAVDGGQLFISTDSGVSWSARESPRAWASVASSADGTKLVAAGGSSSNDFIFTSTDSGTTWTQRGTAKRWKQVASSADGSRLVAVVSNENVYRSADSGVSWVAAATNRQWTSVASSADGKRLAAVSSSNIFTLAPNSTSGYLTGIGSSSVDLVHVGSGTFVILNSVGNVRAF
jgi:hypothetical protein